MKFKIRKIITILFGFLILMSVLCSCNSSKEDKSVTEAKLPKIKIGVDILQPFFMLIIMEIMQVLIMR